MHWVMLTLAGSGKKAPFNLALAVNIIGLREDNEKGKTFSRIFWNGWGVLLNEGVMYSHTDVLESPEQILHSPVVDLGPRRLMPPQKPLPETLMPRASILDAIGEVPAPAKKQPSKGLRRRK